MKFSIVTPSRNQALYIAETIISVITQEGNFEVEYTVMDGGSTDGTIPILKKFDRDITAGKYSGYNKGVIFNWVSKKDKGQSSAINEGVTKVTGDIIAYLNSDDVYTQGCFEKIAEAFKVDKQSQWLTGYCRIIDERNVQIQKYITRYKNFWLNRYTPTRLLMLNFISQPATFCRKSAVKDIGLFDQGLDYTMDYDFWLRLSRKSKPIILREYLASFRIHRYSKGAKYFRKQFGQDLETSCRYTDNKLIRLIHYCHNRLIVLAYLLIK